MVLGVRVHDIVELHVVREWGLRGCSILLRLGVMSPGGHKCLGMQEIVRLGRRFLDLRLGCCCKDMGILLKIVVLYQIVIRSFSRILGGRRVGFLDAHWNFVVDLVCFCVFIRLLYQHFNGILALVFVVANRFVHAEDKQEQEEDCTANNDVQNHIFFSILFFRLIEFSQFFF